jgi:hypothetical protein
MPKIGFASSNVRSSDTKFPAVKLTSGEYWRVVIAEPEPTFEWVHQLRKPKLSPVTGKLQERKITTRDGEERMVPDMEFVGSPICLGNLDALEDRGVDPDHCPVCKAALDYPDFFSGPERRFAVHVLKYGTKPGTPQVSPGPLNLETRVWRMSEARYAKVVSVIEEFAQDGDPRSVDIVLGPCTNQTYQNYEIAGSPNCVIRQSEENLRRAVETFQGNNAGDLSSYCGRKAERRYVESDIAEIVSRWRKAQGGGEAPAAPDFSGTLAASGAGLLEGSGVAAPAAAAAPPAVDLSALDDTVGQAAPAEESPAPAQESAPAQQESPAPAESKGSEVGFGDLLASLGVK